MKVIQEYLFKTLWGLTTSFLGYFDRQPNQRALCCFSSWCHWRCRSWCYSWISGFLLGSKECTRLPKTTALFESSRSHHRNCPPFVDSSRTTGSRVRPITMVRCALSFFNETKLITIGVGWEQLFMSWMTRNSRQKSIGNPSLCGIKLAIGHTATNTAWSWAVGLEVWALLVQSFRVTSQYRLFHLRFTTLLTPHKIDTKHILKRSSKPVCGLRAWPSVSLSSPVL